jgi:hypothetical protein
MHDEQARADLQLALDWIDAMHRGEIARPRPPRRGARHRRARLPVPLVSGTGQAGCPGLPAGIDAAHAVE